MRLIDNGNRWGQCVALAHSIDDSSRSGFAVVVVLVKSWLGNETATGNDLIQYLHTKESR